jgi:uncharacterized protein YgbK (DUF1537 family)
MKSTLILADDLSGAADAAAAYARHGMDVVVAMDHATAAVNGDALDVLAVDLDSRYLDPAQAEARVARATERLLTDRRSVLYKKIDSTLRGNFAAEIAAARRTVAARRATGNILAVVAPAFPATGRTVRDGRVRVGGVPLEEAATWSRAALPAHPTIGQRLEAAGLRATTLPLTSIRSGAGALGAALSGCLASGIEAVVCDAETDDDLAAIAAAGSQLTEHLVWAGSGGLAHRLAAFVPDARPGRVRCMPGQKRGPIAVVVGSMSAVSREQAARLAGCAGVVALAVEASALHAGAGTVAWALAIGKFQAALSEGSDVVLTVADRVCGSGRQEDRALALALGQLVGPAVALLGGIVATGGDTARAVLTAGGIDALRLHGEVEPGIPFGMAERRAELAVVTKAGGFGSLDALVHCREHLRSPLVPVINKDRRE